MSWPITLNGHAYVPEDFEDMNYAETWPHFFADLAAELGAKVSTAASRAAAAQAAAASIPSFTISTLPPPEDGRDGDIWYRVAP